ncbi:metallophosphoesterase family protein [Paenibacillus larvae]|uniref:metallophosphoesterase family protein n=1 Tax=Paenibacillus larvae TaxID=1464 RepID=UPI000699D1D8|nr:metallophosphoesterase [Paenibacillus larvae]
MENQTKSVRQALVITSDPQYPWTPKMDDGGGSSNESDAEKERVSEKLIREQYQDINSYTREVPNSSIIINGDYTSYGRMSELSKMRELVKILDKPYYYGLGNHDIENNKGTHPWDGFFQNSMNAYVNHVKRHNLPKEQVDFKMDSIGTTIQIYKGSFSYAVDFGDIYSIQLNNFPTMEASTEAWSGDNIRFRMYPNLDWLEKQLQFAKNAGKFIIVNVHKPNSWEGGSNERFKKLLKEYDVKAVFCGHYHTSCGDQKNWYSNYFGDIPVFLSGSASQSTYLILEYTGTSLDVYSVRNNNWKYRKLEQSIKVEKGLIRGTFKIDTALKNDNTRGLDVPAVENKPNGSRIVYVWDDNNTDRHKWFFDYNLFKDTHQIKNEENRLLVLAWIVDSPDSGKVWVHPDEQKDEHYWILEECEDGYYIIKNYRNPNYVLFTENGKNGNEIKLIYRVSPNSYWYNNTRWKLRKVW